MATAKKKTATKQSAKKSARTSTKKSTKNVKRARELPYWLAPGEKVCEDCDGRMTHSVEAHCADCDAALCLVCAEHVRGEIFCATCKPKRRTASW